MIGQTISHYRITGQLGSGGMGVVYEAEDLDLGRRVALKFLPPQLSRDQNALDRFLLEARTASALNHPNICTIYAVEKVGDQSFIAMELLEGDTLDRRLSPGLLPLDRLLDWSIQLSDALDAAHAKGIIHRDIKPANIFITQRGQVKVLDFGLAKLARPEMAMETIGATHGFAGGVAPDQSGRDRGHDRLHVAGAGAWRRARLPAPIYSRLGVVIYQMATGRLPFSGATSAVIFHAILELDPAPASAVEFQPAAQAGRNYWKGAGKRPRSSLPIGGRPARRSQAAEAGYRIWAQTSTGGPDQCAGNSGSAVLSHNLSQSCFGTTNVRQFALSHGRASK